MKLDLSPFSHVSNVLEYSLLAVLGWLGSDGNTDPVVDCVLMLAFKHLSLV